MEKIQTEQSKKKKNKNKYKVQVEEVSSTTAEDKTPPNSSSFEFVEHYEPRSYLLVKPGGKWFDQVRQEINIISPTIFFFNKSKFILIF